MAMTLDQNAWLQDIVGALTLPLSMQYEQVRERLVAFTLDPSSPDNTVWCWCSSSVYSASSAYNAMFHGQSQLLGARYLWKVKTPMEFKFFFWLAL
jgi:hypothetical protein